MLKDLIAIDSAMPSRLGDKKEDYNFAKLIQLGLSLVTVRQQQQSKPTMEPDDEQLKILKVNTKYVAQCTETKKMEKNAKEDCEHKLT